MPVGDSAAVAVENDFFRSVQLPVVVEQEEFSGLPAGAVGVFIRGDFHEGFLHEDIDGVYAVFVCVFFQAGRDFFPDLWSDKVKYAAAENDVVFGIRIVVK